VSEEQNARRRLSTLPGFTAESAERARLTQLPGLTNRVFKVELGNEALCLRIPGAGTASLIDRRAEEMNARAAAQAGVAPEIVHFDADGAMLTRFVDGAPVTPAHLVKSPGALRRTAAALRTLHVTAPDFTGVFRAFETMERYLALVEAAGRRLPVRHRHVLQQAGALRAALAARPAELRPCHCDPTGRNIIDTGERVWLVDWEYAAMNDPMWDLAYFSVEAELTGRADLDLLTAYLGRPPHEVEAARLAVTKAGCELLAALWALVQGTQGNRVADFRGYAERTFSRAAERMGTAEFARQLEAC
jgi:thiamine kinase-like enzyme